MFIESSRYYGQKQMNARARDGRSVTALCLRKLPLVQGDSVEVKGNGRLDAMAQERYAQATWFWHIADANTELEANALVHETGRIIEVPES
jgi:hypothetical protein